MSRNRASNISNLAVLIYDHDLVFDRVIFGLADYSIYSKESVAGTFTFSLPLKSREDRLLPEGAIVRVMRNAPFTINDSSGEDIFTGVLTNIRYNTQRHQVVYEFSDGIHLMQKAIVAYHAGQDGITSWENEDVDVIADDIIEGNVGSIALTSYDRLRDGPSENMELIAFTSGIDPIDFTAPYKNVHSVIKQLADMEGKDIRVVLDISGGTWDIYFYAIRLDQTSKIFLNYYNNDFTLNEYVVQNYSVPTVGIGAGQGSGEDRTTSVVEGGDYNVDYANFETFVDVRNLDDTDDMDYQITARLNSIRSRKSIKVDLNQSLFQRVSKTGEMTLNQCIMYVGCNISVALPHSDDHFIMRIKSMKISVTQGRQEKVQLELLEVLS